MHDGLHVLCRRALGKVYLHKPQCSESISRLSTTGQFERKQALVYKTDVTCFGVRSYPERMNEGASISALIVATGRFAIDHGV